MSEAVSSLPEVFVSRLREIIPPAFWPAVVQSFQAPKRVSARVNTLLVSPQPVIDELRQAGLRLEPISWLEGAFSIPAAQRQELVSHPRCRDGHIYIQNASSMLVPVVLAPRPGEQVLDLAAAPGGKTLQIAAMMNDTGYLAAVEAVRARFFRLKRNLEHHGVTCARLFLADGTGVGRKVPERFDRVLLDAPCSSEGRFHCGDARSWQHWRPAKNREMARKQKRLLGSAVDSLKPGGVLVYATCSFAPEENEAVVDHVLRRCGPTLAVSDVALPEVPCQPGLTVWNKHRFDPRLRQARRILPDERYDGFFICRLRKVANPIAHQ